MQYNLIRERLESGAPTISTRMESLWADAVELAGTTHNFDFVEFNAESGSFEQGKLEEFCRAAELHGMGSIIKIDFLNHEYVAQKAIASGFHGVLFADHKTPEQVEASIRAIRPATPEYNGGYGYPKRRLIGYQTALPEMDYASLIASTVTGFMIENRYALDAIDEICSVKGVDLVQFGSSDYSMGMGKNKKDNAIACKDAEYKMIEAALKHGVGVRVEIDTPEQADEYLAAGVRHFCLGDELKNLFKAWNAPGRRLREIIAQSI